MKPTTVLHLRLPGFRRRVMQTGGCGRCQHGAGAHEQLRGHAADGSFRTAKCKIYPPALNAALADAVFEFIQTTCAGSAMDSSLPQDLSPFTNTNFVAPEQVQPDYYEQCVQV